LGNTYTIGAGRKVLFCISIKITQDSAKRNAILANGFDNVPFSFSLELARTSTATPEVGA